MKAFLARTLVVLALAAATWTVLTRRRPGLVDGAPEGPGPSAGPAARRPQAQRRHEGAPAGRAPSGSASEEPDAPLPPPPEELSGDIRLGPRLGEDAWVEAHIGRADRARWRLYLSYRSQGECVFLERAPGGRYLLVESIRSRRRVLAAREHGLSGPSPRASGPGQLTARPASGPGVEAWARVRGGTVTVWADGERIFAARSASALSGRAGFQAGGPEPELHRLSVKLPSDPAFFDDFMREGAGESWRALSGRWELAGVHFAERSANPFALRARFPGEETADSFLDLRPKESKPGVGIHFSSWRGVVNVERITGNGPASEAGVREHDIVLAIDGKPYRSVDPLTFFEDLDVPPGNEVKLTLLRPGELRAREVTLKSRVYRWGRARFAAAIPGVAEAPSEGGSCSIAVAGESFWDGYRYEASAMCPGGGGAGLAFAVRDRDNYHLLRAVGDAGETGLASNRLALVRVRGGRETVLAGREWGPRAGTYYRLAVDLEGERLRALVDGTVVLEARGRDLPAGKIGLWALKGAGAYFDDVAVSTDRASTAPKLVGRATAVEAEEQDMRRWANPADEWAPDPESEWWWNIYRFPGDVKLTLSPEARCRKFGAVLGAGRGDPTAGAVLTVDSAGGDARLEGDTLAEAWKSGKVEADRSLALVLTRDRKARLFCKEREVLSFNAARPGDAVAICGLSNLDEPGVVQVTSTGILDYYFRRAPVDWAVECGRWGIKNKWICDPRFSWFGGHSRSLAAIWNKHRFGGDVTLDFYAALVMRFDDPPYERVGDFNCAILADGESLASGYTLVVSGGRNRWTRLYGAGKLLAESREVADRMPPNVNDGPYRRDLHQRWFRITLERVRGRVRFLFDGREVFNVPDTLGRKDGHCALWTQDNGMLVSRARIAADAIEEAGALAWRRVLIGQELGGLTNFALGEVWTRLELDGVGPSGGPAVCVTNARAGGAFAAASVREASSSDRIAFDFRAEPGAKVDLYLERESQSLAPFGPFRVRLTGPRGDRERHPVLAGPLARADGKWHRVEVDLGLLADAWNASHPATRSRPAGALEGGTPPLRARFARVRPTFCNFEEGDGDDYLPAGIGGNSPGARYWVGGLRIEPSRARDRSPPVVRSMLFPGEEGTPPGMVRVIFEDARKANEPLRGTAAGRCALPRGTGVDERSILVALDRSPLGPRPPGSAVGRRPMLGRNTLLPYGHGALRFDALRQELAIDLAAAGPQAGSEPGFAVEVRAFRDRAGNAGEPFRREWRRESDRSGPALVELSVEPAIRGEVDLDFEPGTRSRRELGSRARVFAPLLSLDEDVAAGGASSARITVPEIRSYVIFDVLRGYANLDRLLWLSFDYRLPEQTPVNLVVSGGKSMHSVLFTDRGDPISEWSHGIRCAGEFDEARADGLWHRARLPLAATFRRAYPNLRSYLARGVFLADWGWRGLWPGDGYWIDNLRIEGARRGCELAVAWRAFDLSGIAGAACALDGSPDTVPTTAPRRAGEGSVRTRLELPGAVRLPDGPAYFHLRLKDGKGNWSRTLHKRVLLDNTPPRVVRMRPADGEVSARRDIAVRFEDYSGVAPATVKLRVAVRGATSRVHTLDYRACRFDRAEEVLRWSARGAGREAELVAGARVDVELLAARDLVGNELALPVRWSWIYDPSADPDPPPAPSARFTTHRPPPAGSGPEGEVLARPIFSDTNDFERDLGQVESTSGCEVALEGLAARHGKAGARITVTSGRRGRFVARLRERYWHADEKPFLLFDYRLPAAGVERLALRLDLLREKREIELVGKKAAPAQVGAGLSLGRANAPGKPLVADGSWHRTVVDLGRRVREWGIETPVFLGRPYRLARSIHLVGRARAGDVIDIDNVELAGKDWRGAVVEIELPSDESGRALMELDGFAIAWGRRPDTVPPETVTHPLPAWMSSAYRWGLPARERRGLWYLHVRARDLAGNWGPATHLAVDLAGAGY